MEKIFLKPSTQEILSKGPSREGHLDIFSYDYDTDESKRKLGNLFIVGNVQQDETKEESDDNSLDVNYVLNLVASLAKREYYSKTDESPKEAFNFALKKINDVVDEFFKNKETRINIGIFAVTPENIYISKIGKFKIILSREGRNIDIINNIDLFSREKVQEKEFSHIVSGKIQSEDKLFAFYPSRVMVAREKGIKESLSKLGGNEFVEMLNEIKKGKSDFACAALYIELSQTKEPAMINNPAKTPKRQIHLSPVPSLATVSTKESVDNENPELEPVLASQKDSLETKSQSKAEAMFQKLTKHNYPQIIQKPEENEVPQIIASEFSLGKKTSPILAAATKTLKLFPRPKNRNVFFIALIILILGSIFILKSIFLISPADKQAAAVLNQGQSSLKLAKTKISQNDIVGARQTLVDAILVLNSDNQPAKNQDLKNQLYELLDTIDKATEASLTLADSLPTDIQAMATLIQSEKDKITANQYPDLPSFVDLAEYSGNLYVLTSTGISKITDVSANPKTTSPWLASGTSLAVDAILITADGNMYVFSKSGVLTVYYKGEKKSEFNTYVLPDAKSKLMTNKDSDDMYLVNKAMNRIYVLSKSSGSLSKTIKIGSTQPISDAYLGSAGELYISTSDNKIWQVK